MADLTSPVFSLPLLQAVNDWQIGGGPRQKAKRGAELLRQAQILPSHFRASSLMCFRQLSLLKGSLWQLADTLKLPETISAWTVSPEIARQVKGGVPPPGEYTGIILAIPPSDGTVVVNLDRLYRDRGFLDAIEENHCSIVMFGDGFGRYWNNQREVVIQVSEIQLTDIHELGGYSSSREEVAELYFGHKPLTSELAQFDKLLAASTADLGPDWIGGDAKDRVITKIQAAMPALRTIKELQSRAAGII
jgi:hypothetical protein